jgi:hypothetical protein
MDLVLPVACLFFPVASPFSFLYLVNTIVAYVSWRSQCVSDIFQFLHSLRDHSKCKRSEANRL